MRQIIIHLSSIAVFLSALLLVIRLFMLLWQCWKPEILSKRKLYFLTAEMLALALILISCTSVFLLFRNDFSHDILHRDGILNNMRSIVNAMQVYASEDRKEWLPPLTSYNGYWVPEITDELLENTRPTAFTDPHDDKDVETLWAMECRKGNPYNPDPEIIRNIMAEHFIYFGYSLENMDQARKLVALRREGKLDPDTIQEKIPGVYRLRDGIERFLITDINNPRASAAEISRITLLMTRKPYYHFGKKGYYLLMSGGYIQFIESGKRFPALPEVVELFTPTE